MRFSQLYIVLILVISVSLHSSLKAQPNPDSLFNLSIGMLPDRLQDADSVAQLLLNYVVSNPTDNDSLEAKTYFLFGVINLYSGKFKSSAAYLERALDTRYTATKPGFREYCLNNLGVVYEKKGNFAKALDNYYQSLRISEQLKDSTSLMQSLINISLLEYKSQNTAKAVALGESALRYFEQQNDTLNTALCHQNLSIYLFRQKKDALSSYHMSKAKALYALVNQQYRIVEVLISEAVSLSERGQYQVSNDRLDEALALAVKYQYEDKEANAYWIYVDNLMALGQLSKVPAYLGRVDAIVEKIGWDEIAERTRMQWIKYYARLGNYSKASEAVDSLESYLSDKALERSEEAYEEIKVIYELDKINLQKDALEKDLQLKSLQMSRLIIALIISVLASIIIGVLYNRLQKNLRTMYRMNLLLSQSKISTVADETMLTEVMSAENPTTDKEDQTEWDEQLYETILRRFERDKLYTNPNFGLQDLADLLKRNRKTVSGTIKYVGKTNFAGLINNFRVNEPRRLIMASGESMSMNDIALKSGFSNRVSFNRHFKEITGFTPTAYLQRVQDTGIDVSDSDDFI
jgi:AraC-like DNA-binding protein